MATEGLTHTRVVIAEDYEPTQYLIRRLLEVRYHVVAVVSNGRALLDAVEDHHPHVVVVDIAMPVMNGIVAASRLKSTHPEVKIVFVSAHSEPAYRQEAFKAGADCFVLKNVMASELVNEVASLLPGT